VTAATSPLPGVSRIRARLRRVASDGGTRVERRGAWVHLGWAGRAYVSGGMRGKQQDCGRDYQ